MKPVTLLLGIISLLLISGCAKEIIKEVPKTEYIYPQLKIADCNEYTIISSTEHLTEQWNSQNYTNWKNEYNIEQFFYLPFQCSYKYNWSSPNCSKYANAVMVYENCSIYYLNTKELYEGG